MALLDEAETLTQTPASPTIEPLDQNPPPPITVPPSIDPADSITDQVTTGDEPNAVLDPTIQDLYPTSPEGGELDAPDVADVIGAETVEADLGVGEVATPGGTQTAEETVLTPEQQVDAELTRILGKDSPLLAQARAEAMRQSNKRGLMNSSMAIGASQAEMVKAALPMAQQNAAQAFQRESENTQNRQEAGLFTAEQANESARLQAELQTALEQGNTEAYNRAAQQLADLRRSADQQQAELNYAADERRFLEQQAYNEQIIDSVRALNEQYLRGTQAMDLEEIRGTYNQIISTNETAATLYDSYMNSIGNVMANENMTPTQIASAVSNMQGMLEASLRMVSEMNNIDFGDVEFIPPQPPGPGNFPDEDIFR